MPTRNSLRPRLRPRALCIGTVTALTAGLVLSAGPAAAYQDPGSVDGMVLDAGGEAIVNDVEQTTLAPGLEHVAFERLTPAGWLQINVLRAELSASTVRAGYLGPDHVAGKGTISEFSDEAGALAGINGDFFDINNSFAPVGAAISETDGLLKSPNPGRHTAVGFDGAGLGSIAQIYLTGQVTFGDTSVPIDGVNLSAANGVAVYNSLWGDYSRARILQPGETGVEVLIDADGVVTSVSNAPGSGVLPEGVQAVVARPGAHADALATLEAGDRAEVGYALNPEAEKLKIAVGGQPTAEEQLLKDGVVTRDGAEYNAVRNPRTAVGFDEDGDTAYFVTVDGRQATSIGMPLAELGRLMKDLGADDALNLDGGGSTQMNTRRPGDERTTVANSPSDGFERTDANGLGLFLSQPGSGRLTGFSVAPAVASENADRVFPGLHRTLVAKGHDETLSSVPGTPGQWTSDAEEIAAVADGVVTGAARGTATVTAGSGATGSTEVEVLGPLQRVTASQNVLNLEAAGSSAAITLTGSDAEGFSAPIEGRDVTVDNPAPDAFEVVAQPDGTFVITAKADTAAAIIGFDVAGIRAEVSVTVPLELRTVDDFSDVTGWSSAHDRAPGGSVTVGEGHEGSNGLHMTYDFTQSTATRGQYAVAPNGGIPIPGQPQKLSVWVHGDGNGSLLRLQVLQENDVRSWLDGADGSVYATFEGWQRVDFQVPSSFDFPITLERIRALETTAVKQYTGELIFSKIYAYLPPEAAQAPAVTRVEDPLVAATGATDDAPLRVAVMSDAQFVARDPESPAVQGARDALREIVAEDPDVLVINGDFVDEASVEDFALAQRILDEELAGTDFPVHYVPGNHEVMGASIQNFVDAFGAPTSTFDVDGTRFITMNSASGRLSSDYAQMAMLQEQLRDAQADPAVTGVVVFAHHPTNDPLPTKASQITDRNEAAMIDDWLQTFRADSGKSVAMIGAHVGVFHTSRIDGVPYVINGNSGKSPASTPKNGGFTGWTMLGIDPDAGIHSAAGTQPTAAASGAPQWLTVETQTRVDRLTLSAPESLKAGETEAVEASLVQDESRDVAVAWPVSHAWSGSPEVFIGTPADAPETAVVAFDPATRELTGLRAGTAELTLAVNDASESMRVTVAGDGDTGGGGDDGGDGGTGGGGDGSGGAGDGSDGIGNEPGSADGDLATTGTELSTGLIALALLLLGAGAVLIRRLRAKRAAQV